jgi:hypothetical protein
MGNLNIHEKACLSYGLTGLEMDPLVEDISLEKGLLHHPACDFRDLSLFRENTSFLGF